MNVIYKQFKDAGLCDILVQASIMAEGSVEAALSSHMYIRGIRCYELVYEALVCLLYRKWKDIMNLILGIHSLY